MTTPSAEGSLWITNETLYLLLLVMLLEWTVGNTWESYSVLYLKNKGKAERNKGWTSLFYASINHCAFRIVLLSSSYLKIVLVNHHICDSFSALPFHPLVFDACHVTSGTCLSWNIQQQWPIYVLEWRHMCSIYCKYWWTWISNSEILRSRVYFTSMVSEYSARLQKHSFQHS